MTDTAAATHTPGPWKVKIDDKRHEIDVTTLTGMELVVRRQSAGDAGTPLRARAEANARLIAAAPAMLAALEEAADYLDQVSTTYPGDGTYWTEKAARAREVIRAARGGEKVQG